MADSPTLAQQIITLKNGITAPETLVITLGVIILLLVILFSWIFDRLGLKEKACNKLDTYYPTPTNESYFNNDTYIKLSC